MFFITLKQVFYLLVDLRHIFCLFVILRHVFCLFVILKHAFCLFVIPRHVFCLFVILRHAFCAEGSPDEGSTPWRFFASLRMTCEDEWPVRVTRKKGIVILNAVKDLIGNN